MLRISEFLAGPACNWATLGGEGGIHQVVVGRDEDLRLETGELFCFGQEEVGIRLRSSGRRIVTDVLEWRTV